MLNFQHFQSFFNLEHRRISAIGSSHCVLYPVKSGEGIQMTKKLLYKCVWHNDRLPSIRIYVNKDGNFTEKKDGYGAHIIGKRLVLGEIASAFASVYGYQKTVMLNTGLFEEAFGSDNIHSVLHSKGIIY